MIQKIYVKLRQVNHTLHGAAHPGCQNQNPPASKQKKPCSLHFQLQNLFWILQGTDWKQIIEICDKDPDLDEDKMILSAICI